MVQPLGAGNCPYTDTRMTGTSAFLKVSLMSSIPSHPGNRRSSRTGGLLLFHQTGQALSVAGDGWRIAWLGDGVTDVPEGLGVVVDGEYAHLTPELALRAEGPCTERDRRGEQISVNRPNGAGYLFQVRPVALSTYPATMPLHDALADGQLQTRDGNDAPETSFLPASELPEQIWQVLRRTGPIVGRH